MKEADISIKSPLCVKIQALLDVNGISFFGKKTEIVRMDRITAETVAISLNERGKDVSPIDV